MKYTTLRLLVRSIAFGLLLIGGAACESDDLVAPGTDVLVGETVTADFAGFVSDTLGRPVGDVEVVIGDRSTTTDAEGHWVMAGADVTSTQAVVRFRSSRHLESSRTLVVRAGGQYAFAHELLARNATIIDGGGAHTVRLPGSRAEVLFPAGAFAKTDGTPHTGAVHVSAHYLDPTHESAPLRMPGDLRAVDAAGEIGDLTSLGMASVVLTDAAGAPLRLRDGVRATLRMPIPSALRQRAEATIPLWYFDEARATWVEEGEARREGDFFVGEVSHFTWWNCDYFGPITKVCLTIVVKETGPALPRTATPASRPVRITPEGGTARSGHIDQTGRLCGIVPANVVLTITLLDRCGDPLGSVTAGPLAPDECIDLGTLTISPPQLGMTTISGRVFCRDEPVDNGFVRVRQTGQLTYIQPDGTFTLTMFDCNDPVTVYAQAFVGDRWRSTVIHHPTGGHTQIDTVQLCPEDQSLAQLFVDGRLVHSTRSFRVGLSDSLITVEPVEGEPTGRMLARLTADGGRDRPAGTYPLRRVSSVALLDTMQQQVSYDLSAGTLEVIENGRLTSRVLEFRVGPVLATERGGGQHLVELRVSSRY